MPSACLRANTFTGGNRPGWCAIILANTKTHAARPGLCVGLVTQVFICAVQLL